MHDAADRAEMAALSERVDGLRDLFIARLEAVEKATSVATAAVDYRLAGMNEFRTALNDQAAQMATRRELEEAKGVIEKDLRVLRDFQAALEGKASQLSVSRAQLFAFMAMGISIASLVLKLLGI